MQLNRALCGLDPSENSPDFFAGATAEPGLITHTLTSEKVKADSMGLSMKNNQEGLPTFTTSFVNVRLHAWYFKCALFRSSSFDAGRSQVWMWKPSHSCWVFRKWKIAKEPHVCLSYCSILLKNGIISKTKSCVFHTFCGLSTTISISLYIPF